VQLCQVVLLGLDRRDAEEEERPFVGVGAENVRYLGEVAVVVQRARLVGEEAAIDDRVESVGVGQKDGDGLLPQAGERIRRVAAADGFDRGVGPLLPLSSLVILRVVQPPLSLMAR